MPPPRYQPSHERTCDKLIHIAQDFEGSANIFIWDPAGSCAHALLRLWSRHSGWKSAQEAGIWEFDS